MTLAEAAPREATHGTGKAVTGVAIAIVTKNQDPDGEARVQVRYPWYEKPRNSYWARLAMPMAGKERGFLTIPEVGDEVLVGFAKGDTRVPFIMGGLYNGVDTPPLADQLVDSGTGQVELRALVSRTNHRMVLSDQDSDSHVLITTGDDNLKITLDQTQTSITIDSSGKVTISGSQGVEISSGADVSVKAGASLSVEATGSLSLKGMGVTIDGGPSVTVSGAMISLG